MRRVVTAHTSEGKAVVLFDDDAPQKVARAETGIVAHWIWTTDCTPADIDATSDKASVRPGLAPSAQGTIFRIVDFPPSPDDAGLDHAQISKSLGLHAASSKRAPPRHPLMHFTETVDYAIVMSGTIDMLLDDSVVSLGPGDVIVQQGTNHAWINRGTDICRIAFVLVDAKPL